MLASDLNGCPGILDALVLGGNARTLKLWSMFLSYHRLLILTTHSNDHTT